MSASGTAVLDFGAFPGVTDATVAVTGQTGIVAGSLVGAWIRPAATASYTATILADNPSAYWRLGEPSGTNAVDEATGNDGTYTNTPTLAVAGALGGSGDADTAVTFTSAQSEYVTVPDSADLDLGDGPFSIEFWVKLSTTSTTEHLIGKGSTGGDAYNVLIANDGSVWLKNVAGGSPIVSMTTVISDTTTWHHVVFTKNGATRAAYLDGAASTTLGADVTLGDSTDALFIGSLNASGPFADASLDEVALYQSVLSAAQVLAHYEAAALALDHSADEHRVEELFVVADTIEAGTGFTIYGRAGNNRLYGAWSIAWAWS